MERNRNLSVGLRDPAHLEAHRKEYALPLEEVLALAREAVERRRPPEGAAFPSEDRFFVRCPKPVGMSGLATVRPWTRGDYWAPRPGRSIPSHLIQGRRKPTRDLCVWGYWEDRDSFLIHTLYPGRPAPREIHDPEISPAELPKAIAFWKKHAIIVEG